MANNTLSSVALRGTPPESLQEVYERVRDWIARPGAERCYSSDAQTCVYEDLRTGNRCAIGSLFGEAELSSIVFDGDEDDEGTIDEITVRDSRMDVLELISSSATIAEFFYGLEDERDEPGWWDVWHSFLSEVQTAHDSAGSLDSGLWQDAALCWLDNLAVQYSLNLAS